MHVNDPDQRDGMVFGWGRKFWLNVIGSPIVGFKARDDGMRIGNVKRIWKGHQYGIAGIY